ncbi:Noranthrone synthase protein [Dioscorea alata]|uniref:Noranthrone synthase protein n=1 Tax=Dioscorea alata TaxID=55571 RepID=A0ACB7VX01_DIOAL|nr:Noranthrone synthase protein [Dioscorea alata]
MAATESEDETPAIRALGSLFKTSDYYLWDDAVVDTSVSCEGFADQYKNCCSNLDAKSQIGPITNEYATSEDLELAQEREALGLPLAFSTAKEKRNLTTRRKRHGAQTSGKSVSVSKDIENKVSEPFGINESKEAALTRVFHDRTNSNECILLKEGENDTICFGIDVKHVGEVVCSDRELSSVSTVVLDKFEKQRFFVDVTDLRVNHNIDKELTLDGVELGKNIETLECHLSVGIDDCPEMIFEDAVLGLHLERESSNKGNENGCSEVSCISYTGTCVETDCAETKYSKPFHNSPSCDLDEYRDQECPDNSVCFEFGDWKVAWDTFYMRYYFYNRQTQESTWSPPEGLEFAFSSGSTSNSNDMTVCAAEDDNNLGCACDTLCYHGASSCRTGKLQESICDTEDLGHSSAGVLFGLNETSLTSGFKDELDASQCMDKEENDTCVKFQDVHDVLLQQALENSLSAQNEDGEFHCPETFISMTDGETLIQSATMRRKKKLRKRQSTLTMEGGVGDFPANVAKYWCQRSNHVIAIDIDSQRIDFAQHNAAIYGVSDKIDFINADFFQIAHCLKGDSVFLSPPWGGPDYTKVQKYDMETMLKPQTGSFLFKIASKIAPKVVMFLPRNVDLNQLAELALSATPPWSLEVERNFLNGKLKTITAYFENTAK